MWHTLHGEDPAIWNVVYIFTTLLCRSDHINVLGGTNSDHINVLGGTNSDHINVLGGTNSDHINVLGGTNSDLRYCFISLLEKSLQEMRNRNQDSLSSCWESSVYLKHPVSTVIYSTLRVNCETAGGMYAWECRSLCWRHVKWRTGKWFVLPVGFRFVYIIT
jgi:hypothetical protein